MAAVRTSSARGYIEAHLGSRDVARVIYGAIIGLALVVALEAHPPTATQAVGALLGTALAVAFAEVYSEAIGTETRTRQRLRAGQVRILAADGIAVAVGAGFPATFFLASAVGAFDLELAFRLAKWSGLGMIAAYGFFGARLAGSSNAGALLHAVAVGAVGGFLIVAKALLH